MALEEAQDAAAKYARLHHSAPTPTCLRESKDFGRSYQSRLRSGLQDSLSQNQGRGYLARYTFKYLGSKCGSFSRKPSTQLHRKQRIPLTHFPHDVSPEQHLWLWST